MKLQQGVDGRVGSSLTLGGATSKAANNHEARIESYSTKGNVRTTQHVPGLVAHEIDFTVEE